MKKGNKGGRKGERELKEPEEEKDITLSPESDSRERISRNSLSRDSLEGYGTATLPSFSRGRSSAPAAGALANCWLA